MRPVSLLGILAAGAVAAAGLIAGWQARSHSVSETERAAVLEGRVGELEEENLRLRGVIDRMARAGAVDDPEAVIRGDLERLTGELRALEWMERPPTKIVTRQGVRDLFVAGIEDPSAQAIAQWRNRGDAMAAMGWVEAGFDLKKSLLKIYSGEATAWFDETRRQLYVARGTALEEASQRVLLVHELARALADQHFDLKELLQPMEEGGFRNTDMLLARKALVAGDAGVLAAFYNREYGSPLAGLDGPGSRFGAEAMLLRQAAVKGPGMEVLFAMAAFAHREGARFCGELHAGESFLAVDKAYGAPPATTAEILHPELYLRGDFVPRIVSFDTGELARAGGSREAVIWEDVAGELGISLLLGRYLEEERAAAAAEGWFGDRFVVVRGGPPLGKKGGGKSGTEAFDILWVSHWSDREQAVEFQTALGEFLTKRYGLKEAVAGTYDGKRFLRVNFTPDGLGVVLLDAGSAARRRMLEELVP